MLEAQRGHKWAEDAEQRLRQTQADAAQAAQLLAQAQQKQQVAEQQAQAAAGEIQDNQGHQCCSCEWVQQVGGGCLVGGLHSQGPISPAEEVEKERRQRAAEAQAFLDEMEGLAARELSTWPAALRILCQQREASAAEVTLST